MTIKAGKIVNVTDHDHLGVGHLVLFSLCESGRGFRSGGSVSNERLDHRFESLRALNGPLRAGSIMVCQINFCECRVLNSDFRKQLN